MRQIAILSLLFFTAVAAKAQNTVIDFSGDNTVNSQQPSTTSVVVVSKVLPRARAYI